MLWRTSQNLKGIPFESSSESMKKTRELLLPPGGRKKSCFSRLVHCKIQLIFKEMQLHFGAQNTLQGIPLQYCSTQNFKTAVVFPNIEDIAPVEGYIAWLQLFQETNRLTVPVVDRCESRIVPDRLSVFLLIF